MKIKNLFAVIAVLLPFCNLEISAQSYNEIQTENLQKFAEYIKATTGEAYALLNNLGKRYEKTPAAKREEFLHALIQEADNIPIDQLNEVMGRYHFVITKDKENKHGLKHLGANRKAYLFELRGCDLLAREEYNLVLKEDPNNADAKAGIKRIKKRKRKIRWNNLLNNAPSIAQTLTDIGNSMAQGSGGSSYDEDSSSSSSSSKKSKGSKKKSSASKGCKHCGGTGKCTYCNGDGFNYVAGNPVQCTACKGHLGRCKWCNK